MNIDSGIITLWRDLTTEEKESGRWVKLGEDELARAMPIGAHERTQRLNDIFKLKEELKVYRGDHPFYDKKIARAASPDANREEKAPDA